MLVDLVQTITRDDLRLDGAYLEPTQKGGPVDAVVLLHGTGGNFYSSTMFDVLTEKLRGIGCGVLRANTRGHDGISTAVIGKNAKRLGAAYELVDDCRHDLDAWVRWLRDRAGHRIGLLGHSLGAAKCLYAVAQEPKLAPTWILALSPPRLSYSTFVNGPKACDFFTTFEEAQGYVHAGKPGQLMEVTVPLPFVIAAAGYVEKYGPEERYNFLNFVRSVACPTLFTFGELEVRSNPAFQGLPEAIEELRLRQRNLQVVTIPGADHFYTGVRDSLVKAVETWILTQS